MLGILQSRLGQAAEAEATLRRALTLAEAGPATLPQHRIQPLLHLAALRSRSGRLEEAESLARKGLALAERLPGAAGRIELDFALAVAAPVLRDRGYSDESAGLLARRWRSARRPMARCTSTSRGSSKSWGPPSTAGSAPRSGVGGGPARGDPRGDAGPAAPPCSRISGRSASSPSSKAGPPTPRGRSAGPSPSPRRPGGPDHPDSLSLLHSLAVVDRELGRLDEADRILRRVLGAVEKPPGFDAETRAACLLELATVCTLRGRSDEADQLQRRALAARGDAIRPKADPDAEWPSSLPAIGGAKTFADLKEVRADQARPSSPRRCRLDWRMRSWRVRAAVAAGSALPLRSARLAWQKGHSTTSMWKVR